MRYALWVVIGAAAAAVLTNLAVVQLAPAIAPLAALAVMGAGLFTAALRRRSV